MNKLKRNARILLILIISAFIIIPIVAVLVSKLLGVQENMEEYEMSGKNVNMDVVKLNLNGENVYGYCLGGDIKCRSSDYDLVRPSGERTYSDRNGTKHKIFKGKCECKKTDESCSSDDDLVKCDARNVKKIVDEADISQEHDSDTNLITLSDKRPDNFLPWDISTNGYVYLYNKQDNIDASFSACHLYGDCPDEENEEDEDKKKKI